MAAGDEEFVLVDAGAPTEAADGPRPRVGLEKLAAFADDVFSGGESIPIGEIELFLGFMKFSSAESGGRTNTTALLLDLESRLLSQQQTYGKEAGSNWEEFIKEEGFTLPAECNSDSINGRRKRAAYALSKFLTGVVYLPDAGRALSTGRIAMVFPPAGTGFEAEASVADVVLIAGALNVVLPVDQSDASALRTCLLAMSAKIQPVAAIGLAALRTKPEEWRAAASTLQQDGSLRQAPRGLRVGGPIDRQGHHGFLRRRRRTVAVPCDRGDLRVHPRGTRAQARDGGRI